MPRLFRVFLAVIFWTPALLIAETVAPLQIINNNPTAQIFGLPFVGQAKLLSAGEQEFSLMDDVSSIYIDRKKGDEELFFDGELQRSNFIYRLGVGGGQEWQVVIPYVGNSGGSLDGFIEDWHKLFNLPQSGRQNSPHGQLRYFYSNNGINGLDFDQAASALGDIRLQVSWQLVQQISTSESNTALSASLKLPTGNSDRLTGSGATDLAIWVRQEQAQRFYGHPGGLFFSGGMLLMGNSDVLPDIHENLAFFGGLGAGVALLPTLHFITQLDMHTTLYPRSNLPELGGPTAQLSLGGRYDFARRMSLDFGVAEDLLIDASPDITLHLELTMRVNQK